MATDFPQRVDFKDGRFLQAADLDEEQRYHIQRRWQHNLALHSWGILCGLDLTVTYDKAGNESRFLVRGGMALDGFGRELVVTNFVEKRRVLDPAVSYDVWLSYNLQPVKEPDHEDQCYEAQWDPPTRLSEEPTLQITETMDRQSGSVSRPDAIASGDNPYAPQRPMRFDREDAWPVFVGRVEMVDGAWVVDKSERYYGGLTAERVEFPLHSAKPTADGDIYADDEARTASRTVILNGGDSRFPDWRFAVLESPDDSAGAEASRPDEVRAPIVVRALPPVEKKEPPPEDGKAPAGGATKDAPMEIRLQAERVVAEADVILRDGAGVQFERSVVSDTQPTPPTAGWGMYRAFCPPTTDNAGFADVLQISMPGRLNAEHRVAIGATDESGKFVPILVVRNDETVDIFGPLRVHGEIYGGRSDLPTSDHLSTATKLKEAIAKLLDPTTGVDDRKAIVQGVAEGVSIEQFGAGLENATPVPTREAELFKGLAKQLVNRIGERPEDAGTFASNAKGAEHLGTFIKAFHSESSSLITEIVNHADAKEVAATIEKADNPQELALYVALATRLVECVGGPTGDLDAFAENAVKATAAAFEPFLTALLSKAIAKVGGVKDVAEAIGKLKPDDERGLYIELAKQLVNSVGAEKVHADAFAAKLSQPATPAESLALEKFLLALTPLLIETVKTADIAGIISGLDDTPRAEFFAQFVKGMPDIVDELVETAITQSEPTELLDGFYKAKTARLLAIFKEVSDAQLNSLILMVPTTEPGLTALAGRLKPAHKAILQSVIDKIPP